MSDNNPEPNVLGHFLRVMAGGVAAAFVALCLAHRSGGVAAVGIGSLIFLASFAIGCFLGFLFGVPRTLSKEQAAPPPTAKQAATDTDIGQSAPGDSTEPPVGPPILSSNTNLERISDWLTTLLVGAGLTQLHSINDGLVGFREYLEETAKVFDAGNGHMSAGVIPSVGPLILLFGLATGFLYMYLNTRLVLIRLFLWIEGLLQRGSSLRPSAQRAVRAFVRQEENVGSFVSNQIATKSAITVEDTLNLMFDLLYRAVPDQVIDLGERLANTGATQRADYWFYLAAAYGQKLHRISSAEPDWPQDRANALDCSARAVSIDPGYKLRLWRISDPNSTDNDLAPLRDDPDFLRVVGRA